MKIKQMYELKHKAVGKKLGLEIVANERHNPTKINMKLYSMIVISTSLFAIYNHPLIILILVSYDLLMFLSFNIIKLSLS